MGRSQGPVHHFAQETAEAVTILLRLEAEADLEEAQKRYEAQRTGNGAPTRSGCCIKSRSTDWLSPNDPPSLVVGGGDEVGVLLGAPLEGQEVVIAAAPAGKASA